MQAIFEWLEDARNFYYETETHKEKIIKRYKEILEISSVGYLEFAQWLNDCEILFEGENTHLETIRSVISQFNMEEKNEDIVDKCKLFFDKLRLELVP